MNLFDKFNYFLILSRNIKFYMSAINPETLEINIHPTKNVGQIKKYNHNKININLNPDLKANLKIHWENFTQYIF